jgi:hypothetical protein
VTDDLRNSKAPALKCRGFAVARPHPLRAQESIERLEDVIAMLSEWGRPFSQGRALVRGMAAMTDHDDSPSAVDNEKAAQLSQAAQLVDDGRFFSTGYPRQRMRHRNTTILFLTDLTELQRWFNSTAFRSHGCSIAQSVRPPRFHR